MTRTIAPDLAQVVCPPYDVIDPAEQARLEAQSPLNAVRLELPSDAPGQPGSRYAAAAQRLAGLAPGACPRTRSRAAYYLSETTFTHAGESLRRRDLLAALEVEPWEAGAVLPHEHTMAGPKADRLELLRATHLNCSPIWVLQRDPLAAVEEAWSATDGRAPDIEFTWRDEGHRIWLVDDASSIRAIQHAFENGPPLYIADGHHRYETALAFRNETHTNQPGSTAMLAAITSAADPGLLVLPTHRVLRGLDETLTLEEAEANWSEWFHLEYFPIWDNAPAEQIDALMQQLASTGRSGPALGLLGLGQLDLFGLLSLRGSKAPAGVLPAERSEAWRKLDVSLAHALLIDTLIAATGKPREEVLSYTRDPHAAFHAVREGQASAAVFLNPTPVDGVLAVADAHDRMPEKSTYFYPKPPAGLVMRDLSV